MIDCTEAVRRMWAYLSRELEAPSSAEIEQHLDACQRCCGELEFSRHLRTLVARVDDEPAMPAELRRRIEGLLAGQEGIGR